MSEQKIDWNSDESSEPVKDSEKTLHPSAIGEGCKVAERSRGEKDNKRKRVQYPGMSAAEHLGADPLPSAGSAPEGVKGIYVASRASIPERAKMWLAYQWHGFPIVSTWINEAGDGETTDLSELWTRIASEIRVSCALVLYIEPGDLPLKGALIEVGMALALGKPVFAVMPGVELEDRSMRPVGSWLLHPLVTVLPSVDVALNAAKALLAKPSDAPWKVTKGIACPFCGEDDFDKIGLKQHLQAYCEVYLITDTVHISYQDEGKEA